ncbi:MAG: sn-glycerol-3-phosphate ABC transporter ATP-binding protein UgpC [Azospirillaceae bacterium]|nr:sn-glycerol-3-phosphate ABC transporter ATP-binding protein UgpC [Azospirillaceae bacterium]
MAELALVNVEKSFGATPVIRGVDFTVKDGEFVVFVGPSGCGKSTLLRMIAGLETVGAGQILIDGENVAGLPPADRGIAMVFQSYALYPHMNVARNLSFGLENLKMDRAEIDRRVNEAARMLAIESFLKRKPKELSGGQRQRVAIGRAIVRDPKIFLFDEPLSNLDAALRVQTRAEISGLHKRLGATMIYVTHDQIEAMTMADRIVVLNAGRVEQFGSPIELFNHPANRFVAGFIGSPRMNFYPARLIRADGAASSVEVPGFGPLDVAIDAPEFAVGTALELGVRPSHLRIIETRRPGSGELIVTYCESIGTETYVYGTVTGTTGQTIIHLPDHVVYQPGDRIAVAPRLERTHLFDAASGKALMMVADPRERHDQAPARAVAPTQESFPITLDRKRF